ncbi:unnamed protein product [Schistosoma curassoni]|uniref:Uncharacterized protein n=1 Tax=Schistosoma curassoni TaxID=6186 RepID=A0A183JKH2_9TREM|nr:unnamed protein product [Schistosoma curassoni]
MLIFQVTYLNQIHHPIVHLQQVNCFLIRFVSPQHLTNLSMM